jgi:hypothetical protein
LEIHVKALPQFSRYLHPMSSLREANCLLQSYEVLCTHAPILREQELSLNLVNQIQNLLLSRLAM